MVDAVAAGPAVDDVGRGRLVRVAGEQVVARPAEQLVGAAEPGQLVVAVAALECVMAFASGEFVVARAAVEAADLGRADQLVVAGLAVGEYAAGEEQVDRRAVVAVVEVERDVGPGRALDHRVADLRAGVVPGLQRRGGVVEDHGAAGTGLHEDGVGLAGGGVEDDVALGVVHHGRGAGGVGGRERADQGGEESELLHGAMGWLALNTFWGS